MEALKAVLLLGILVKCISCNPIIPVEKNATSEVRMLFGNNVDISRAPFFAGLRHCGAAILNKKWAITAAHCVAKYAREQERRRRRPRPIWVGGNTKNQSTKYRFNKVFVHPRYDGSNYDIALIKLVKNSTFAFGRNVNKINLPRREFCEPDTYFFGKGTDQAGHTWNGLKYINMLAYSCNKNGVDSFVGWRNGQYSRTYAGICHGDFGGPLVDQHSTLIGIARKNDNPSDCYQNVKTYFVDVYQHLNFIYDTMNMYHSD